uniref:Kinetochore protein SPC25 n=1 Tax=Zea mays TaxID=4577 RepID=B8A2E0_MAIZE|nr:unknown [Zea mays]
MADAAADLRRRMKEQRAAIQRRFIDSRNWAAAASSAFSAALLEARSIANQTVSNRAKLSEQKQHLRKLESDLAQALSVQTSRRSKHNLMTESILKTTATNEQLTHLVTGRRATRDECMNAISIQLKDIESLESESDTNEDKNLEKALIWYNKFLGFQVVGGEGVKFMFNKIDVQSPDKECYFCVKLVEGRYTLVQCVPSVDGAEELVKDPNCNNDLYKFVRVVRDRLQAAIISGNMLSSSFCADLSSITSSSFSASSLDSTSENNINRSQSKNQECPVKGLAKSLAM